MLVSHSSIKNTIVKMFILRGVLYLKALDTEFDVKKEALMEKLIEILGKSLNQISEAYKQINSTEDVSKLKAVKDEAYLLSSLIRIVQEVITEEIAKDKICCDILKV
jgi:lipopolysaccharide biosynthesis regulator YciM